MRSQSKSNKKQDKAAESDKKAAEADKTNIKQVVKFWVLELPIMLIATVGLVVFIQNRDAEAKLLAERSMAYAGLPLITISYILDLIESIKEKTRRDVK